MYTPKFLAKTEVTVKIFDGFDENGSPVEKETVVVKARTESSNGVIYGTNGHKITLKQKAFVFEGFESFHVGMSGHAFIGDDEYNIANVRCLKNPDGSINHYVLELV